MADKIKKYTLVRLMKGTDGLARMTGEKKQIVGTNAEANALKRELNGMYPDWVVFDAEEVTS